MDVKRVAFYLIDVTGRAKGNPDLPPTREQLVEFVDSMARLSKELNGDPEILVVRGNFVGVHVADKLASSRDEFLEYIKMISAQGVAVERQYQYTRMDPLNHASS